MRYDSEVSSDVIKCHQMSPLLLREHKKLLKYISIPRCIYLSSLIAIYNTQSQQKVKTELLNLENQYK